MEQQLKVFVEVVEQQSFSRAAEVLYMSQPAVSQYIASLEKEFGVRLLERSNKFVRVNRAGEIVYQYAKEIIRNYDQMKLLVSDIKNNPSGQLRIGASYTIGEYLLPKILAKLQIDFPKIIPSVSIGNTEDIGKKLIHHEIDIGLIEGHFTHPQILSEKFSTDKMYIITGGRQCLKGETMISRVDLEQKTWIIREQGSGTREVLEEFFKKNHINPKRIIILGSTQTIKEGVESGLGISLLSELTLDKELRLHTIHKLEVEGTPIQRDFSIIKNHQEFHPKALQTFETLVKSSHMV